MEPTIAERIKVIGSVLFLFYAPVLICSLAALICWQTESLFLTGFDVGLSVCLFFHQTEKLLEALSKAAKGELDGDTER